MVNWNHIKNKLPNFDDYCVVKLRGDEVPLILVYERVDVYMNSGAFVHPGTTDIVDDKLITAWFKVNVVSDDELDKLELTCSQYTGLVFTSANGEL